jgi:hypothetical protein
MPEKWLYATTAKSIQDYLFSSGKLKEVIGGSELHARLFFKFCGATGASNSGHITFAFKHVIHCVVFIVADINDGFPDPRFDFGAEPVIIRVFGWSGIAANHNGIMLFDGEFRCHSGRRST